MRRSVLIGGVLVVLMVVCGCAKERRVSFHVRPGYDPAVKRTYFVKRTDHSNASKVLQDTLERDLIAKGYAPAATDGTPDFEITYAIEQYRTGRENPAPKGTLELGDSGDGTYFGKQIYYANVWKVDLVFRDPITKEPFLEGGGDDGDDPGRHRFQHGMAHRAALGAHPKCGQRLRHHPAGAREKTRAETARARKPLHAVADFKTVPVRPERIEG